MLRYNYNTLLLFKKFAGLVGVLGLSLTLTCCSSGYPSIADIKGIATDALTPAQQKKVINDLTQLQKTHQNSAIRDIENKK